MTEKNRRDGSYYRRDVKNDVLYSYYRFRELNLTFSKKTDTVTSVQDGFAEELLCLGYITESEKTAYEEALKQNLTPVSKWDKASVEELYAAANALRLQILGDEKLETLREQERKTPVAEAFAIDQRAKKQELLRACKTPVFVLTQANWFETFRKDVLAALEQGKTAKIVVSAAKGGVLPSQETFCAWLGNVGAEFVLPQEADGDSLFFYGEEGLLHCRSLTVPAVVHAVPVGFHACALTNLWDKKRTCVAYVPPKFDMTRYVPVTAKTRLHYGVLAALQKAYGDGVYEKTTEELYRAYPQYFVNVYDPKVDVFPLSVTLTEEDDLAAFDAKLQTAAGDYLEGFSKCRPLFCRGAEADGRSILVHGVRLNGAQGAEVLSCTGTLRETFAALGRKETAVVSNFLFFLTPKLGNLYNGLRKDRPMEQCADFSGHLDYSLTFENGVRKESFPLFQKSCIAMKQDGKFLFFRHRLGGGEIALGGETYRWEETAVNCAPSDAPVQIFTPMLSCRDEDAPRETYTKAVGQGRVNLVLMQNRVICLRKGDVLLPAMGVVLSLEEGLGAKLLQKPLTDGYYAPPAATFSLCLDTPAEVTEADWSQVVWAYGGGMGLIAEQGSLDACESTESWFRKEGWLSPLSRQTQESSLHTLTKHPRCAIGVAKNGDLVLLVFSGRTAQSAGADYLEMCRLARELVPDLQSLMNMDGGGSAVLGMVKDGSFMELSLPSTSSGSTVGMARSVKTVLYLPLR